MRVTVGPTLMSAIGILLLTLGTARTQGVVLPLPPGDQQKINAQLGTGVVGNPLPSEPIEDVSVYFPLRERAYTFRVMSGHNAGKSQTLGLVKASLPSGEVAWRFQLSPSLASFIVQTLDGDLTMPALIDAKAGVVVITTPANPFVPKGMKPGETRSYSQQVSVNYLDDPSDQEYSGSLSGTYTYVGTYHVMVPAGTFAAILLRVKCQGKVGPAHTQNTAYNFFAPGIGEVAMIMQEDVEAFWIYHIDSTSGKVLMSR
jgi:hypothetical protein